MIPTFAGGDNLFRILAPHERAGPVAVVGLQVGVHGIHQRLQGGEVAALQAAPRQFGEETFHGVHPGTGSGGEVKVPVGVSRQPGVYGGGFVGGVIVQNHVHRGRGRGLCGQGIQESQELLLAVFRLGLGLDLSGLHIQGSKEGGGAMPDVIMGLGGGLSRAQGQAGLGAFQGLDLRLLIHGQHQGLRRRIQIQADHVPGLAREVGVRGNLELAAAMRGQPMLAPDAVHGGVVQAHLLLHTPASPVGGPVRGRLQCAGQHRLHLRVRDRRFARRARPIAQQAVHPASA